MNQEDTVIIVDPYASGYYLLETAKSKGFRVGCVISVPVEVFAGKNRSIFMPYVEKFENGNTGFDFEIYKNKDESDLEFYGRIKNAGKNIKAVIAGSEIGVNLSDEIANYFGVPSNDASTVAWRRNKALMKKVARKAGLRTPGYKILVDKQDINEFVNKFGFPVIVKTPNGGASVNVFKCNSILEIEEKHNKIITTEDCWGNHTDYSVMEEFIGGTEYQVNVFINGDQIQTIDMWLTEKIDSPFASNLYINMLLVNPESDIFYKAGKFAEDCAKAVGIRIGPAHVEIKIDENGPALIEIASRMGGVRMPKMISKFSNFDFLSSTIDVFMGKPTPIPKNLKYHKHIGVITCPALSENPSHINPAILEEIKSLSSYYDHISIPVSGPTTDLRNYPLYVWLVHDDFETMKKHADIIHEMF